MPFEAAASTRPAPLRAEPQTAPGEQRGVLGALLEPGHEAALPHAISSGKLVSAHSDCVWALHVHAGHLYSASADRSIGIWPLPSCNVSSGVPPHRPSSGTRGWTCGPQHQSHTGGGAVGCTRTNCGGLAPTECRVPSAECRAGSRLCRV